MRSLNGMKVSPAPIKLYLPIVSALAALSNRKEYSAFDLTLLGSYSPKFNNPTDLAEILRYASVGVNISAGMVAHIGTRFGGFEEFLDADITSCMVCNDG